MKNRLKTPFGMQLISIYYLLSAIFLTVFSIQIMSGNGDTLRPYAILAPVWGLGMVCFLGPTLFAIIAIIVAIGLFMNKKWANILAMILAILGVINALSSIAGGQAIVGVSLILHLTVGGLVMLQYRA